MRVLRSLALSVLAGLVAGPLLAQGTSDVPRNETLIVENPEGTIKNAGWFNIWATNAGGQSTGLHQLAMDTFWYIDPEHGLDGVWDNSLASEPPIYNDDFTEMTVKLRPGIYWSDGVEFTADDVVFTTNTHLNTNGLVRSAQFQLNVESVEAPDKYTVVFKLKKPNSRFHALFTVRWNAAWMMPKHVFEGKDPLKFDFNPPVSLGAYTLQGYDPNGQWFTWQKRDDWQRTTLGRFGEPGPKFVTYLDPGPPDKRVIAQLNHDLDIIHDTSPEGVFTLVKQSPSSHGWFAGFPYGHPDPTLPQVIFNHQNPKFQDRDVRWALALALDIKAIVDGLLPRRRDDLGDRACRRPARRRNTTTSRCRHGSPTSSSTPARRRSSRTTRPSASRSPTCCGRRWATKSRPRTRRSARRSASAGGSRT